jgi:hypothetical protein
MQMVEDEEATRIDARSSLHPLEPCSSTQGLCKIILSRYQHTRLSSSVEGTECTEIFLSKSFKLVRRTIGTLLAEETLSAF